MSAYRQATRQRPWIQIDGKVGVFLCIAGGIVFVAALSGWLIIVSDLSELKDRLSTLRKERLDLAADVRSRIGSFSARNETIEAYAKQAEAAGLRAADSMAELFSRLAKFEEAIRTRQDAGMARERREPVR